MEFGAKEAWELAGIGGIKCITSVLTRTLDSAEVFQDSDLYISLVDTGLHGIVL